MCKKVQNRIAVLVTSLTFLLVLFKYQKSTSQHYHVRSHPQSQSPHSISNNISKYLINNLVCSSGDIHEDGIRLIMLITSHPGDTRLRNKLRQILPTQNLRRLGMRRLFLLGRLESKPPVSKVESKYKWISFSKIQEESQRNQDILVGDFLESYHNLTTKHLMGLQWVDSFCSQAQFLLKQDDDIIVDYFQLDELFFLPPFSVISTGPYILGKVLNNQSVIRDPESKWFVTRDEYGPSDTYPPFVSGWAYITTPKVARLLLKASQKIKYLWIDDAHITGTIREAAGIQLLDLAEKFTTFKGQLQCCVATPQKSNKTAVGQFQLVQPYWCDYVVGPPNDDLVLMELFHAHARFCHTTKICRRRKGNEGLEKRCVITSQMVVNRFPHPFGADETNSKGSWKSLGTINLRT